MTTLSQQQPTILTQASPESLPRHIALIPDGNRRWARSKGIPVAMGHARGVDILGDVLEYLLDRGVRAISVWGSSMSNLRKRPDTELSGLFRVFEDAAVRMLRRLNNETKRPFQVRVSGLWEDNLPPSTVRGFRTLIEESRHNHGRVVQLLMAYDGRLEMLRAINSLVEKGVTPVTPEMVKAELWTHDLPPVDLVVRSGCEGDPHWSEGFMMWDVADAQMYFSEQTWPDFGVKGIGEALESYLHRERRLGK